MRRKRAHGEGSIRRRSDGRWEARLTVSVAPDGKARQRSFYGRTRAEVREKLREALEQQHKGLLVEPDRSTVSEWLERWLDTKRNVTEKTRAEYRRTAAILGRHLGKVQLQKLRPVHIKDAYLAIADAGYSPRTQRFCAMTLKAALTEALELGLIAMNPASRVKLSAPRVERKAQAWGPDEVARFLAAARGELVRKPTGGRHAKGKAPEVVPVSGNTAKPCWYYPAFHLMITLGLRVGEALGLMWDDIDWKNATLTVQRSYSLTGEAGGKCALKAPKTARSIRQLYLPHDAMQMLEQHRQRVLEVFSGTLPPMVITAASGAPVNPSNLRRAFRDLCKTAGVRPIRLHDLRHTYASLALQRGVPLELVSERLGHATPGFTLSVYRHLYDAERKQAALSLDELLGNAPRVVN